MTADHADTKPEATRPAAEKKPAPSAKKMAAAGQRNKSAARSAKKPPKRRAGGKPVEEITSKADLIRKVAGIIKAKGEKPRPNEIVKILKEEGVTVAAAQVSMTLKAAGYRPLRKRRKGKSTADGVSSKKAPGTVRGSQISIDDLLAAKSVSGAFGGTDKAIAALQALKQLER
jgi:hypothetical protein